MTLRMLWRLPLATALCLAACNGPDLCTRSVDALQKIGDELAVCIPDAGLLLEGDAGLESPAQTAFDISMCQQELTGCTSHDQTTLNTAVSCLENLPPFECAWLAEASTNPLPLAVWGLDAESCYPTQPLSSTCQVLAALPFDGGLP